jgi:hypothetical protein
MSRPMRRRAGRVRGLLARRRAVRRPPGTIDTDTADAAPAGARIA